MRVRAIDMNNDWTFGKGKSNYKVDAVACAQNIKTRLQSFLADCFWQTDEGIDWFTFMGGKDKVGMKLAIAATLLKTPDVISVEEVSTNTNNRRKITIQYSVISIYGRIINTVTQEV